MDAVGRKLDFILADLLFLRFTVLADPVGFDGRLFLVKRTFPLGQRVFGQQQRGDFLAPDLLFDRSGNCSSQRLHPFRGLKSFTHEPCHGLHVFLAVNVHWVVLHVYSSCG